MVEDRPRAAAREPPQSNLRLRRCRRRGGADHAAGDAQHADRCGAGGGLPAAAAAARERGEQLPRRVPALCAQEVEEAARRERAAAAEFPKRVAGGAREAAGAPGRVSQEVAQGGLRRGLRLHDAARRVGAAGAAARRLRGSGRGIGCSGRRTRRGGGCSALEDAVLHGRQRVAQVLQEGEVGGVARGERGAEVVGVRLEKRRLLDERAAPPAQLVAHAGEPRAVLGEEQLHAAGHARGDAQVRVVVGAPRRGGAQQRGAEAQRGGGGGQAVRVAVAQERGGRVDHGDEEGLVLPGQAAGEELRVARPRGGVRDLCHREERAEALVGEQRLREAPQVPQQERAGGVHAGLGRGGPCLRPLHPCRTRTFRLFFLFRRVLGLFLGLVLSLVLGPHLVFAIVFRPALLACQGAAAAALTAEGGDLQHERRDGFVLRRGGLARVGRRDPFHAPKRRAALVRERRAAANHLRGEVHGLRPPLRREHGLPPPPAACGERVRRSIAVGRPRREEPAEALRQCRHGRWRNFAPQDAPRARRARQHGEQRLCGVGNAQRGVEVRERALLRVQEGGPQGRGLPGLPGFPPSPV